MPTVSGQALVYPYFTARSTASGNAYMTALSVVNTTASAKAVKVRFLEGKNSREVLDFNLFLSQYDVWTAGIVAAGAGAGLFTTGQVVHVAAGPRQLGCVRRCSVTARTPATTPAATRSTVRTKATSKSSKWARSSTARRSQAAVTHKPDLSGAECVEAAVLEPRRRSPAFPTCTALRRRGGLMGTASLINVNEGTDFAYDAVALDGLVEPGPTGRRLADVTRHRRRMPRDVGRHRQHDRSGGRAVVTNWALAQRR